VCCWFTLAASQLQDFEMTCPLCHPDNETVLWHGDFCRVIWVDDAAYPGFCRIVLHDHVQEMSDLMPAERQRLMAVVFAVEEAVRAVVNPDKINLASLGNMVPHLHWHVIPRWQTDRTFPDAIWAAPRREGTVPISDAWREALAARLAASL
jgi:diadenosine tetraphosphate (Ap4A) HIT family hydrolase